METTKYQYSFVILAPSHDFGKVQSTINSIVAHYPTVPIVCAVGQNCPQRDHEALSQISFLVNGKGTITSLINSGLQSVAEWGIFIFEGSYIPKGIVARLFRPVKTCKDIVFPIMPAYDRLGKPLRLHDSFSSASLNGMLIHHNAYSDLGEMTDNPIEISKMFWGLDALEEGYSLKGVLGPKIP